jgi:uncharacterized membrane protein
MEQKVTTPVVKGVIIALVLIVLGLVIQFTGQQQNKGLGAITFLLFIAAIIWSCISYAKQLDGNVTFGNTFAHGFKTTSVITVLIVIFTFISIKFINPEMIDLAIEEARKGMEDKNMSDDQVDTAIGFTRKFFVPLTIGSVLFFYLIVGVIGSLIGAAVAKKNPQGPFQQPG